MPKSNAGIIGPPQVACRLRQPRSGYLSQRVLVPGVCSISSIGTLDLHDSGPRNSYSKGDCCPRARQHAAALRRACAVRQRLSRWILEPTSILLVHCCIACRDRMRRVAVGYRHVPKACCALSVAAREVRAPPLRRGFSSAHARDGEQEAMHQAIRESVRSLCK